MSGKKNLVLTLGISRVGVGGLKYGLEDGRPWTDEGHGRVFPM